MRRSLERLDLPGISSIGFALATAASYVVAARWLLGTTRGLLAPTPPASPRHPVTQSSGDAAGHAPRKGSASLKRNVALAFLAISAVAAGTVVALGPLSGVGISSAAPALSAAGQFARAPAADRTPGQGSLSFASLATQTEVHRPTATATPTPSPTSTPPPTVTPTPTPPFVWPAYGWISQPMFSRHPSGIDIAVNTGEPIYAVRAGYVELAGGDSCCSYGYFIYVDHEDGWSSLYAHLSSFAVSAGTRVEQGDLLGLAGETGKARGAHLHFELRYGGGAVDPLDNLPAQ